jgi:hypothetical protein
VCEGPGRGTESSVVWVRKSIERKSIGPLLDPWEWIARDDLGSQEIWRVGS